MKKYLFGLAAIVFAVGAVAFTTPIGKRLSYTFQYTSSNFTPSDITTLSNWQLGSVSCNDVDDKPCQIVVDEADTQMDGSNRVLKPGTTINTALGVGGVNHRVDAGGDVISFINKN